MPIYDYRCGDGADASEKAAGSRGTAASGGSSGTAAPGGSSGTAAPGGSSGTAAPGGCGLRFERLVGRDAPAPACPECGGVSRKVPSRPALHGAADPGLSKEQMPQTWRGTYHGNREYLTAMQRKWDQRQRLEAKHPELAGDTRPVAAHEGRYEQVPLRVGDPEIASPAPAAVTPAAPAPDPAPSTGHGHGHGHGHSH